MDRKPSEKKCSKCGIEKELSEFVKNKSKKDGLSYICKQCNIEYQKEWYKKNTKM